MTKDSFVRPAVICFLICVSATILGLWGIRTGLPSQERFDVSLGGEKTFLQAELEIKQILASRIADRSEFISKEKKLPLARLSPYFDQLRTYHPDEQYILKVLSRMARERDIHPRSYIYGPFFFYQIGAGVATANILGCIPGGTDTMYFLAHPEQIAPIYLSGRLVCVFFSIATVALTFLIGWRTGGTALGTVSALLVVFLPLFCLASKFIKPDMPAVFWGTLSLWFALKVMESGKWKNYLLSGVCVGLAAGSKYPAAITGGYLLMFHLLQNRNTPQNRALFSKDVLKLLGGGGACICTFMLTNPASILDARCFFSDIHWVSNVLRSGSHISNLWDGIICYGQDAILYTMGVPAVVMILAGMILALCKRDRFGLGVTPIIITFFFFACQGRPGSEAYLLPVYPALALLAGKAMLFSGKQCLYLKHSLQSTFCSRQNSEKILADGVHVHKNSAIIISALVCSFTLVTTLSYSWAYISIAGRENIRLTAARWINTNIPEGTDIGYKQYPVGYRAVMVSPLRYHLMSSDLDDNCLEAEYYLDHSFEWEFSNWHDRIKERDVVSSPPSSDYIKLIEFENIPQVFWGLLELRRTHMLSPYIEVVSPRITIYQRKKQ